MQCASLPFLLIAILPHTTIQAHHHTSYIRPVKLLPLLQVSTRNESKDNSNNNLFTILTTNMFTTLKLLAAYLLIASAAASPSFSLGSTSTAEGEGDFEWRLKSGNYSLPNSHALGLPKRSTDCNLSLPKRSTDCKALSAREDDTDVKVKVYENSVMTFGQWFNMKKGETHPISPPTFTNLWNDVVAASCNDAECGEHIGKAKTQQHMHMSQGTLEMWLEGTFWGEEVRDALVDVLRQAFDRAVVREFHHSGSAMYEWGPKDLFVIRRSNEYAYDTMRMVLRTKRESEDGCGDIASRILELGGLISPLFGLVSVACATADM